VWRGGHAQQLPTLAGDSVSMALWINDNGQVAGASGRCGESSLPPLAFSRHAVLWERDGTPTDLGTLGGTVDPASGLGNVGLSVNNLGQVVGASVVKGNETTHGFLWSRDAGMRDLGTLAGDGKSFAGGINALGQVVGTSFGKQGPRGYLWERGRMSDFNELVGEDAPLFVLFASAINDRGEVVGFGATEGGDIHGFVARPTSRTASAMPSVVRKAPATKRSWRR